MEWWRKLSVVLSILLFIVGITQSTVVLFVSSEYNLTDFIVSWMFLGLICALMYNGQYEGHYCWETKFGTILAIIWLPGIFFYYLLVKFYEFIYNKFRKE